MAESRQAYVELKFSPSLELIPIVRRFVSSFYQELLAHDDVAARMALATHELLENTVKFASDGISQIHIGVVLESAAAEVTIRTANRAEERNRATALQLITEMKAAGDAFDYYQLVMRRNARRRDGSGLGLARIRAEAEMSLDCELEDDLVRMIARASVPRVDGAVRT